MIQLPVPPSPSGFVPLPFNFFDFVLFYIAALELVLLAMPRKWSHKLMDVLFPILRQYRS